MSNFEVSSFSTSSISDSGLEKEDQPASPSASPQIGGTGQPTSSLPQYTSTPMKQPGTNMSLNAAARRRGKFFPLGGNLRKENTYGIEGVEFPLEWKLELEEYKKEIDGLKGESEDQYYDPMCKLLAKASLLIQKEKRTPFAVDFVPHF